ncbi:MAG: hypothetical protein ACTSSG_01205 [Candidatus Heimdallarchaeaceae archaeon]
MSSSNDEESLPLWKNIIEKIKPFITREDIINMDLESFSALINRLFNIKAITEQEMIYAKKNRDLILIRMGLLHNIPDLNKEDLELGLKQLAVRLTSLYYRENLANNQEEAEKMVLKLIQQGFSSNVTISLNPEEEILKLREKLSMISKITLENAHEIRELLSKTKDDLMNIGVSGSVFYEIDKFIQMLKRKNETELPNKTEIIDASFEWQAKIQK